MKKIILTGAGGFIGVHLAKKFSDEGFLIYAMVRKTEKDLSRLESIPSVVIVHCDLADIRRLPELISDRDIDSFYHFAWDGTSGTERADYRLQLDNVEYSCGAVEAAKNIGCKRFIYAGSVMGFESAKETLSDGARPYPGNIYRTAKHTAHFMLKTLSATLELDFIGTIISNVYGEGEYSGRLINTTLRKFLAKEKTSFSEGKQLYDFIYIRDAVRAFYLAGEHGKPFNDYYIGNTEPRPLREFVEIMRNVVDPSIYLGFGELPFDGQSLSYKEFDTYKLNRELGFVPQYTFEHGIKNTLEWLKVD